MSKRDLKKVMTRCKVVAIPTRKLVRNGKKVQLYKFKSVNQKVI